MPTVDNLLSTTAGHDAFLEQELPELAAGSWLVLQGPGGYRIYAVRAATSGSRADFTLSAKTTGVDLASLTAPSSSAHTSTALDGVPLYDPPAKPDALELRRTVAFALARPQALAAMPYVEPIEDPAHTGARSITLDQLVLGLTVGQPVMVSGPEAGDTGAGTDAATLVVRSEVAIVDRITHTAGRTTLTFRQALAYRYVRASCVINANVILASHGESTAEVLGSGDGGAANQAFVLRKKPLTYVPAENARGAASTLDVKVNGISWTQVDSLYGESPRGQRYLVRHGEDGTASVEFGDGVRGARLPSGQENVTARYRTGVGPAGNVRARTLSLLLSAPLGVRSAVNPIAASGGAAPEALANARRNAPLTVLTLDRVVSLRDFEDFARGFAGIGKARAQAIWSGERRVVFLSVTDAAGGELDPGLPLYANLQAALHALSDGGDELQLGSIDPASGRLRTFIERRVRIAADVRVDPAFDAAPVLAAIEAALMLRFAFDARELGLPLSESDVYQVIQAVPGVVFARLTRLGDTTPPALPDGGVLIAQSAAWITTGTPWIRPAELLLVSPSGIALTEVQS